MDSGLMASKDATPDWSWSGYPLKAKRLLAELERGELRSGYYDNGVWTELPLPQDGEWVQLGRAYNIGAKLLVYMVENHMLERRGNKGTVPALVEDWYRVVGPTQSDVVANNNRLDAELLRVIARLTEQSLVLEQQTKLLIEHNQRLIVLFEAIATGLNRVILRG
jgi:hypothetical protein